MILYFSATGNSRYVAQRIASACADEVCDLFGGIRAGKPASFYSEKPYVLVFPVYCCDIPYFLRRYLDRCTFEGNRSVYIISTDGSYSGAACRLAARIFTQKGLVFCGCESVSMGSNYVVDSHYSNDICQIAAVQKQSLPLITRITECVKTGSVLQPSKRISFAVQLITRPVSLFYGRFLLKAKKFYATDRCTGCGLCAKSCVLNNISIVDKKPVWGASCTHCMACINKCPAKAIEYGSKTKGRVRYLFDEKRLESAADSGQN